MAESLNTLSSEEYEGLRKRLILYFNSHNVTGPDRLADEALARVLKRLTAGSLLTAGVLAASHDIAANVLSEYRRRQMFEKLEAESQAGNGPSPSEQRLRLKEAIEQLPPEDGKLLRRYYREESEELAASLGMSVSALRVRVSRLRSSLVASVGAAS